MANIKKLPLFVKCVIQNFPFIEEDFDALTNYQLISKVVEFLNKVISSQNEVIGVANNLQDAFQNLHNYVEHYFDNLDVQEEINNKLDQMAEDGTLQEIIATFLDLGVLFTFNTFQDLATAENLVAGSKAQTLGHNSINDGYGAIYSIDTTGDIPISNNLYASVLNNTRDNNYYNEITITTGRIHDTDYRYATIPVRDSENNIINPTVNEDNTKTPLTYAEHNNTTLTTNAGLTRLNSSSQWMQGAVISNGVALHGDLCDIPPASYMRYIGFKADRTVLDFPATTSTDIMIAQGVQNAFLVFNKSIDNGVITIPEGVDLDDTSPRMDIGVKLDGTLIILASDGRTKSNVGLTVQESAELLLSLGCVNAWRCDGGGSTSMVYKGSKQNRNLDNNATTDRNIYVTLNFKKTIINKQIADIYSFIGKERQLLNKQIRDDAEARYADFGGHHQNNTYFNWNTGYNVAVNYDTVVQLQHQDAIGHYVGLQFDTIKNADDRRVGFTAKKLGIYKITYSIGFTRATVSGTRQFRIDSSNGSLNTNRSFMNYYIANPASGNVYNIEGIIVFNNTVENAEYYFGAKGQAGDDFNRSYINVEYIGGAS